MGKYGDASKAYRYVYEASKLKRVPLDVQRDEYDRIKAAADHAGETVNGYIKSAIRQRMDRETAME